MTSEANDTNSTPPPSRPKPAIQPTQEYKRFCPGEERIRISDAICLGRRRSNFPKCGGCVFNDDEKQTAAAAAVPAPNRGPTDPEQLYRDRVEKVFRDCDVLGVNPDEVDTDVAWAVGLAAAQFLRSELRGFDRSQMEKSTVVVGMDMRISSPALAEALSDGLRSGGSPVIQIGMIDTPQLYFAVNQLGCCGGIQVTGGHAPGNCNGFKFCGQKGRPVSTETGLGKICKIAQNSTRHTLPQLGGLRKEDLSEPYRDYVLGYLKNPGVGISADKPLKVVVDASNGMAGRWLPIIFEDIDWLEIIRLNFEHNGEFAHDPDPMIESSLQALRERVTRAQAAVGVCFDGDSDSCIFIDNQGQPIRADLLGALLARHLLKSHPGSTVVYDLRSSRILPEEIRRAGGLPRRERSSNAFVKKAIADTKGVFACELTGQYYYSDNWYCESAMITLAHVLNVLTQTGRPISELIAPLRKYARSGERRFQTRGTTDIIDRLADRYSTASINYLDGITVIYEDWWFNARQVPGEHAIELVLEAINDAMMNAKLAELESILGESTAS